MVALLKSKIPINKLNSQKLNKSTSQQVNNSTIQPFEKDSPRHSLFNIRITVICSVARVTTYFFDLLCICSFVVDGDAGNQSKKFFPVDLLRHVILERFHYVVDN